MYLMPHDLDLGERAELPVRLLGEGGGGEGQHDDGGEDWDVTDAHREPPGKTLMFKTYHKNNVLSR